MKYQEAHEALFSQLHELRTNRRVMALGQHPTHDLINIDHQIQHVAKAIAELALASRGLP